MKRWALLTAACLVGLWLLGGVAYAQEGNGIYQTKKAGNLPVDQFTPTEGAKVGDNHIVVQLRDVVTGQAVARESVWLEVLMDETDTTMMKSHGDMSNQVPTAVELKADKAAPGRYSGTVNFSSAGDWKVRVVADPRRGQAPVNCDVRVLAGGPNWLVIGGILVVVAAGVGGLALAIRRKSATAHAASPALEAGEA